MYYKEAVKESRLNLKPLQKLADLYEEIEESKEYIKYLLLMDKISPLNHKRKINIGEQYSKTGEDEGGVAAQEGRLEGRRADLPAGVERDSQRSGAALQHGHGLCAGQRAL